MLSLLLVAALAAPTHDVVPADAYTIDEIRGFTLNQTGSQLAFVRARWPVDGDAQVRDLWLLDTKTRATTRLTFRSGEAASPTFSPDGAWVYVTDVDDAGDTQLWRVSPTSGLTQQLTHVDGGIAQYVLSQNGRSVWYATHDHEDVDDAWSALRGKWSDVQYTDREVTHSKVHQLDLVTWRAAEVWDPGAYVVDLAPSPTGLHVAAVLAPDAPLIHHEGGTRVVVRDLGAGRDIAVPDKLWRADAPSPYGWMNGIDWALDGRALSFRVSWDGWPGETYVAELGAGDPVVWSLPRPAEVAVVDEAPQWVPVESKRELCYRGADRGRARIVCIGGLRGGVSGPARVFPGGDVVVLDFAFSGDGRDIYAQVGTTERFPEVYRLAARGNALLPTQLTSLNPHTADWKLPRIQSVSWTAPDGAKVEGILETPYGWEASQGPLPLVVNIHGGPTAHEPFRRVFGISARTAFPARGWAVLSPQYRGSTSFGDVFTTALVGRENDIEVKDILAGVDAMVAAGVAKPDQLAVMGWSNGGYLTHALVTATDRFKAASAGAGVVDMGIQWALEDTPGHVINFMGGLPWQQPDAYVAASPLYDLGAVKTPLLLHVGEHDPRVPPAHLQAVFRGLDFYLDVPTELVIYPDAGHGPTSRKHRETKVAWDIAWLEKFTLGKDPAPAEK